MTRPRRPPRRRSWLPVAAVALVIVVFVVVVAALVGGFLLGRGTAPEPEPVAVPSPVATRLPTVQPGRDFLRVTLVIVDGPSGKPMAGDVWVGYELQAENVAIFEFTVEETRAAGAKHVPLKVVAPGYKIWEKTMNFNVEQNRAATIVVELWPSE